MTNGVHQQPQQGQPGQRSIQPSVSLPGVPVGGTLNVYSGVRTMLAFNVEAPAWADLSLGFEYCIALINTTNADITSGTIILEGAEAQHDNPCMPDTFHPLEPVQDCGPIVTGVPWTPPVQIDITPERPIPAHGSCQYAAPCPLQFMQLTGVPAGVTAVVLITRLRRSDYSHYGPFGGIPQPLASAFGAMSAQQRGQQPQQPQQPQHQQPDQQSRPARRGQADQDQTQQPDQPTPHARHR